MTRRFGDELSLQLFDAGISYRELSRRTGLAAGTISQLVNGHRSPTDETLRAIAAALEQPVEVFFEWRRRRAHDQLERSEQLVEAIYARVGDGVRSGP